MKTVLVTLSLILLLAVGCSGPTDTDEAMPVDESAADSIEQSATIEDPSTAEEIGGAVGGTARDVGEAVKEGSKTGIDAVKEGTKTGIDTVVEGAQKVGEAATDAAKGVVEGVKGEDAD